MRIYRIFSAVFLLIGTFIGAGFISGQELLAYFGYDLKIFFFSVAFCAVLYCVLLVTFVQSIKKRSLQFEDFGKIAFPKYPKLFTIFLYITYFVLTCAMLSGLFEMFPANIFAKFAFLVFCAYFLRFGIEGLKFVNFLLVPLILIFILLLGAKSMGKLDNLDYSRSQSFVFTIFKVLLFVSANSFSAVAVLLKLQNLSKKEMLAVAVVFSVIIAACLIMVGLAIYQNIDDIQNSSIINLALAQKISKTFAFLFKIIIFFAIFTTLLSSFFPFAKFFERKRGWIFCIGFSFLCLLISSFGFQKIITMFYPFTGVIGLIFFGAYYVGLSNVAAKNCGSMSKILRPLRNTPEKGLRSRN